MMAAMSKGNSKFHMKKKISINFKGIKERTLIFLGRCITNQKVKNSGKKFLNKLGQYDYRASKLGLYKIFNDDTFIVSYPRSGNTWVRFIIANLLSPNDKIGFNEIHQNSPPISTAKDIINNLTRPRFIKSHQPLLNLYPRILYLVRHPGDVVVSYYYFNLEKNWFNGSISEFIRSRRISVFGKWNWNDHVRLAIDFVKNNPDRIFIVKYEDLLTRPEKIIIRFTRFAGISANHDQIEKVINKCSFEDLTKIEKKYGSPDKVNMFRQGQANKWIETLEAEDCSFLKQKYHREMSYFGYGFER